MSLLRQFCGLFATKLGSYFAGSASTSVTRHAGNAILPRTQFTVPNRLLTAASGFASLAGTSTLRRSVGSATYATASRSQVPVVPSFETPLTHYLKHLHQCGPQRNIRKKKSATEGRPFIKGVVLKTLIKKPKKPNSANRKCVRVRLTTGREAVAYVPGIGHNLQEHHIVLVRGGRVQDLPGVKLKCVRGKYDLAHVKKAA